MVEISFTSGIFFKIIFSSISKVAARIGKDAFLDPEISIVPKSFFSPLIINCFIKGYTFGRVTPNCFIYFPFLSAYEISGG